MHVAMLVHSSLPYAVTIASGLLMVRLGAALGQLEPKRRIRWCAACHQRVSDDGCGCQRRL
jgi:hypothetical protein